MTKLARYLKPFSVSILICIALLFGQAMCDLNLPNLMSNIVNVGIQQNGIANAVPEAVSVKGLEFLKSFMTDAEKSTVENTYTLIPSGGTGGGYEELIEKYPLLATEDIYVCRELSKSEQMELDHLFGRTTWTFINTIKAIGSQTGETMPANSADQTTEMEMSKLYELQPILSQIPQETIGKARTEADQTADSMLTQTGIIMIESFYKELGMNLGEVQSSYIVEMGMIMLLIALAGGVATVLVSYLAARIGAGIARNLRHDIFDKVESFSNGEFDHYSTASLITRTTNDVTQVQMLLTMGIRMICYAPIMGVGGILMALDKSSSMSWIIALAVVVLIGIVITIFSIAVPKFKLMQKLIDKMNLVARENLTGLMVIRAFGTEDFEKDRFDKTNRDLAGTQRFTNRVMVFMMPAMMLIMNCASLLVVWVGAQQIAQSTMQVGDMMAFMQYSMQIIMSFLMISIMFIMIPRAAVSGDRIQEVLATEPKIQDAKKLLTFKKDRMGYVEFHDVSFRYNGADEDVLEHITFTAKPGQTTAFIGSTGSGKSTLINLIPRFYDVTSGEVLVNGVDVKEVSQHELRASIGYVPQKGNLISGTIDSNLRYGDKNADDETVKMAVEVAQAADFIKQKADGINSEISQGGTNVSGGQKQRLSIARALVKKSPIYIFDDSFSALDFKTDSALRHALHEQVTEGTMLIVAQRVSTIMNAEQIIVLDEGKIVGIGTHRQLLVNCPTYYEIASSQLTKEELA